MMVLSCNPLVFSSKMKYLIKDHVHWPRRFIHLSIGLIASFYYAVKDVVSAFLGCAPLYWLSLLAFILVGLEALRIHKGWLFYGQRSYEKKSPSAFVWTGLALISVFLFAPPYQGHEAAFGLPIVWSLAIGDPLLGECRRARWSLISTLIITLATLGLLWILAAYWYSLPYWLALIMPPLAIVGEWSQIRWVDDNFMMAGVPLLFVVAMHALQVIK